MWAWLLLLACSDTPPEIQEPAEPAAAQNLVILLADTLRADHLGAWDYERPTTPILDALASEGLRFTRHYSHSSRTGPSVATIFTGLYPRSHGVVNPLDAFDAKGTLATDQTTLAEILAGRGWQTAGFVTNRNVSERFGFAQGFDTYQWSAAAPATTVHRAATGFLDEIGTQPFFLYLHFMETHSPYDTPPEAPQPFVDPDYSGPVTGAHAELDAMLRGNYTPDEADIAHLIGLYDQSLLALDTAIGGILEELAQRGLAENTTVVFLSDHGEEFLEHGGLLHGYTLFEEQLHIPLVIRSPGVDPGIVHRATRQVDVLPTLLELLGVEVERPFQGTSLVGTPPGDDPPVYASTQIRAVVTAKAESFRVSDWKYIRTELPQATEALYHLAEDPGERQDRGADEPRRMDEMRRAMEALLRAFPVAPGARVQLTEEEIGELRALGYVE